MNIKFFNITMLILALIINIQADIVKGSLLKHSLADETLPVENAQKGSLIQSLSKDKRLLVSAYVLATSSVETNSIIEVDLGDRRIQAAANQTFFDPVLNKWIKAKDLTNKNSLLGVDLVHKIVVGTELKTGKFEVMRISVDGSHYIFSDGVLTHNFQAAMGYIGRAFVSWGISKVFDQAWESSSSTRESCRNYSSQQEAKRKEGVRRNAAKRKRN